MYDRIQAFFHDKALNGMFEIKGTDISYAQNYKQGWGMQINNNSTEVYDLLVIKCKQVRELLLEIEQLSKGEE